MPQSITTKTLRINGMTCVSCENRIEKKLKNTRGIINAQVSYGAGTAQVSFDENIITLTEIEKIIEALDYQVATAGQNTSQKNNITKILGIAIVLFAIYMVLNHFGLLNIFNAFPEAEESMGYGMLFVIGLLTSIHCVAMCGGINLSQCIPHTTGETSAGGKLANLKPSFLYNLGRVISYTIIGGLVGALGQVVSFSGPAKGIVQLAAGVFMVIMGLNMLNIFPWLRKLTPRIPKIFARKIGNEKARNNSPLYVGLLNGLMPCGPLQAMQLYALSTGDPLKGALSMLLFSLGTVPLMFGLGALSSILNKKFTSKMMTVGAVLVVLLGVSMFGNGMSLSGLAIPSVPVSNTGAAAAEIVDGVQTVTTKLTSGRYEPITVKVGIPVRWTIQAESGTINGCNNRIIIPGYQIEKKLEVGENVIEFTPTQSGTVPYSCWMGMIRSSITVVDSEADLSQAAADPSADSGPGGGIGTTGGGCCGMM